MTQKRLVELERIAEKYNTPLLSEALQFIRELYSAMGLRDRKIIELRKAAGENSGEGSLAAEGEKLNSNSSVLEKRTA